MLLLCYIVRQLQDQIGFHTNDAFSDGVTPPELGVNDRTPQTSLVSEKGGFTDFSEGYLKKLRRIALGLIRLQEQSLRIQRQHVLSKTSRPFGQATHQGFGIGVSFLIQENLGHFVMAAVGGHVQGGQVVVGDVVHRHVVL